VEETAVSSEYLAAPVFFAPFCRPFRAGSFLTTSLGLKPQAESLSPFGTKTLRAVSPYRRIAVSPYRSIAVSPTRRIAI